MSETTMPALELPLVADSVTDSESKPEVQRQVKTHITAPGGEAGQAASEDHPDGPAIRRQYYFSDENLPTDLHLLQCCGGRENKGVSLSRISKWKKMRQFKRPDIVQSLRLSNFLEVSEDGNKVKRRIPLVGKCLLDEDYYMDANDDQIAYDPRTKRAVHYPVPPLPQEKKELPPGVTKNMLKPTGFEETCTEGPLPPIEAEEELAMYDPDKCFVERIELAIQRFRQKRRMHEMYAKVFGKWMKFGGVDQEPRMFGGLNRQDMKDMNSGEIARATATYHVPWDRGDDTLWVVDFVGVAEAFLSSFYPDNYGHDPAEVKTACQVLRSFYQYLRFHKVCEEYEDQLVLARALCDKAEKELPQTFIAGNALPGAFNVAASTIFGGMYAGAYAGLSEWTTELSEEDRKALQEVGMRNEIAMLHFKTGVVAYGTDEQYKKLMAAGPTLAGMKVTGTSTLDLEITGLYPADEVVKKVYAIQNEVWKSKAHLQTLGRMTCKCWINTSFKEYDLPKNNPKYPGGRPAPPDPDKVYEFRIEDDVLEKCFVGMKMDATVITLSNGITILDQVKEVFCSFYKSIPNDLWAWNKGPKLRLTGRGMEDIEDKGKNEGDGDGDVGLIEGGEEMKEGEMSDDFDE